MNSRREKETLIHSVFAAFNIAEEENHKLRSRLYRLRQEQLTSDEPQSEKNNLKEIFKKAGKKSQVTEKVFTPETHNCVEQIIESLKQEQGDIFVSFVGVGLLFLGERIDRVQGWMWPDYRSFLGDRHIAEEYEKQKSLTVYIRTDKKAK